MERRGLTPYYFPTTVVFIDDDPAFLDGISLSMPEGLAFRAYTGAEQALAHIHEVSHEQPVPERCFVVAAPEPGSQGENPRVEFDLTPITETLYSEQRFAEVSVAIIDYDMPSMDGLEMCRQLEGHAIRKILLTGKADESDAIRAFNEGLIDHFIAKSSPNAIESLLDTIRRFQDDYFRRVSRPLIPALGPQVRGFLSDRGFVAYFRQLMAQRGWVEYYLDPVAPGLLCLDAAGHPTLVMIGDSEYLGRCANRAQRQAPEMADLLRRGEVMHNPHATRDGDWRAAAVLASRVADSDWTVALVEDPQHLKISADRLLNYNYYLEILDYIGRTPSAR